MSFGLLQPRTQQMIELQPIGLDLPNEEVDE